MEIEKQINIERAYRTDALSSFFCGVREIDLLIHKKENGLKTFIEQNSCEFYIVSIEQTIIALFIISRRTISIENRNKNIGTIVIKQIEIQAKQNGYNFLTVGAFKNKKYNASGFYEKNGFIINGKQEENAIPMLKILTD